MGETYSPLLRHFWQIALVFVVRNPAIIAAGKFLPYFYLQPFHFCKMPIAAG